MGHPNEDLLRQGYAAFSTGDFQALGELFADDIQWHAPGRGPLAGDYVGKEAVFGLFGRTVELSGGTFSLELHDVLANDEHGAVLATATGSREGKTLQDRQVHIFHLKDRKVQEFWLHPGDLYANDEFWS